MEETAANTASYAISARFLEIRGSLNGRLTNSEEVELFFLSLSLYFEQYRSLYLFCLFSSSFSSLRFYSRETFIRIDKFEMKIIQPYIYIYIYILNFVANKFQKWSFLYILIFALSTSI